MCLYCTAQYSSLITQQALSLGLGTASLPVYATWMSIVDDTRLVLCCDLIIINRTMMKIIIILTFVFIRILSFNFLSMAAIVNVKWPLQLTSNHYPAIYIYCTKVCLSFCISSNDNLTCGPSRTGAGEVGGKEEQNQNACHTTRRTCPKIGIIILKVNKKCRP